jgi:hypothetical protein
MFERSEVGKLKNTDMGAVLPGLYSLFAMESKTGVAMDVQWLLRP